MLFISIQGIWANEIKTLPDLVGKPMFLYAHKNNFFIVERSSVHIFSLPKLAYVRTFGRNGAGPGEFRKIRGMYAENNKLHFSSVMEVNVFSMDGEFVKRLRTSQHIIRFFPFKNKYVGMDFPRESGDKYTRYRLLDNKLENGILLYKYPALIQKNNKVPFVFSQEFIVPVGDRLYINTSEGKILCFNTDGKKIKTIIPNITPVPISKKYAADILNLYTTDRKWKMLYKMQKDRLYMPEHLPHILSMRADEDKLLLLTFEMRDGYLKVVILDRDGNLVGVKGAPFGFTSIPLFDYNTYAIHKNKFYDLEENYEKEAWEIHITPLVDWENVKKTGK